MASAKQTINASKQNSSALLVVMNDHMYCHNVIVFALQQQSNIIHRLSYSKSVAVVGKDCKDSFKGDIEITRNYDARGVS